MQASVWGPPTRFYIPIHALRSRLKPVRGIYRSTHTALASAGPGRRDSGRSRGNALLRFLFQKAKKKWVDGGKKKSGRQHPWLSLPLDAPQRLSFVYVYRTIYMCSQCALAKVSEDSFFFPLFYHTVRWLLPRLSVLSSDNKWPKIARSSCISDSPRPAFLYHLSLSLSLALSRNKTKSTINQPQKHTYIHTVNVQCLKSERHKKNAEYSYILLLYPAISCCFDRLYLEFRLPACSKRRKPTTYTVQFDRISESQNAGKVKVFSNLAVSKLLTPTIHTLQR